MFVNFSTILLQAPGGGGFQPIILLVGMVVVMYFFMIRPQAKRAKEEKKFGENIAAGEKIITTAGIHATINRVNEDGTLQVETGRGNFMTIERSAVSMQMTNAFRKKTEAGAIATTTK